MQIKCPARITPLLKVLPINKSGRHPVEVICQTVGLFDFLEIESEVKETTITTNWLEMPVDNKLKKVLNFAREIYDIPPLKIHLTKRIPDRSGLGGSSSNAAGLIRGLSILFPYAFPHSIQLDIARAIGKKVPFFLYGGRTKGTGYEDIIEPLEDYPLTWICLVKPEIDDSNYKTYKTLSQQDDFLDDTLINSFEKIMPDICQKIKYDLLEEQAIYTQLCGTGPTVYGTFLTKEQAQQAALIFIAKGFTQTFVVPTITRKESLWILYF